MNRRRIHVLYEHGSDLHPFSSAHIRLLRPLRHPALAASLDATWGLAYNGQEVDAVIIDRFWRSDISPDKVRNVQEQVHRAGGRLIFALDDDFLSLSSEQQPWFSETYRQLLRYMLEVADGLLVTTAVLADRFAPFNRRIAVLPNALDERLLAGGRPGPLDTPFGRRRVVVGHMGTPSHDDDLMMILPALQRVWQKYPGAIELQIIGGAGRTETLEALAELPARVISPPPEEVEYPLFMLWFSSCVSWDIALAPLRDTPFNRCKSDIKFLDYSAIGAAGIYSRGPAYASSVRHLETGWVAENDVNAWSEALEMLLCDHTLRRRLAANASRHVCSERILARSAHRCLEALDHLLT
jgi:glycosyltransferase involved in cell wall biosynthesis